MRYLLTLLIISLAALPALAEGPALEQKLFGSQPTNNNDFVQLNSLENIIGKKISDELRSDDFIGLKNVYLNKKGSSKKYSLTQVASSNIEDTYLIEDFTVDQTRQQFTLLLKHSSNDLDIEVNGKYSFQIEVPVLVNSISKGDIIKDTDLKTVLIDKNSLRQQVITQNERLVGKMLNRTIAAGKMVSFKDIQEPVVIEKGKMATVIFKMRNMELKTLAEAMENGSEGQIIKFRNTASDKVINAMVTKYGNAVVNYSNAGELAGNDSKDSGVY